MSREQPISPRRQFIRPLSLIQDTVPAALPETSAPSPLSQPANGEQADLTKLTTLKTESITISANGAQSLSSHSPFVEARSDTSLPSSSWIMLQGEAHTSGLFTPPASAALPQEGFISASWSMPSHAGLAGPQAVPQSEPSSSSWNTPQNVVHTSGLLAPPSRGTLPQEGFVSASWSMPSQAGLASAWQPPTSWGQPQPGQQSSGASQAESALALWTVPQQSEQGTVALSQVATIAPPQSTQQKGQSAAPPKKRPKTLKKRVPIWAAVISVILVIMIVMTQGNGTVGAWAADTFRSIAGPVVTAQIEAWYLNAQNQVQRWQFQASGQHVASPFQATPKTGRPTPTPTPPPQATLKPMPLTPMQSYVSPTLDGEGTWNVLEQAPKPYNYLPLDARAFIRPDPAFPYAVVTLLQFDSRFSHLHIVSGTQEPGGPLGAHGAGVIDQTDLQGNTLLAALNGGFKYADGAYGLMTGGKVYVPAQPNAATIAITRNGQLIIGAWGVDPRLNNNNTDLLAWRQNASLLIDKGAINPLTKDGAAWGGTILNSEYTWRSGLGITAQGNLVYAAGNALVPETLGKALYAAGAVTAMETDINPFWVRAFLYQRGSNGSLTITKLNTAMQGTGNEYLNVDLRDFFYLTRYTPPKGSLKATSTTGKNNM
jgi:hypothetical protein